MMAKVRVLHVIKSLGRGGAEMLLPETLKLHDKDTFEFHYIYFLPWKDQMVASLTANGGKVVCVSASNNILLMLKVWSVSRYIHDNKIHVVHAHLPWAGIISRVVGKLTGVPVIYTEHNKQERYHYITRALNLITMNWQDHIIAVSEDVGVSLRTFKRYLKANLRIILNGVNLDHFAPDVFKANEKRNELNIPEGAPIIGTVAVFRFQKRLDVWMEVARKILDKIPSAHFIIVGDGPLKPLLMAKRQELGLEERVHLVGLQTEVRPYLAATDIYMMSSVFEGLPVALLEAMSCGCPVISTEAGGIKEVVRHGKEGLLCPVNDPYQLVGLALELIENPQKLNSLGLNSRDRIKETFSLGPMVDQLEKLYRSVHNSRTQSSAA